MYTERSKLPCKIRERTGTPNVSEWYHWDRDGEKKGRERDTQRKVGQTSIKLRPPLAAEGKRRRSPTATSAQSTCACDLARPGYGVPAVCPPAKLPSCCHHSAAGARLHHQEPRGAAPPDALFCPPSCAKFPQQTALFYVVAWRRGGPLARIMTRRARVN